MVAVQLSRPRQNRVLLPRPTSSRDIRRPGTKGVAPSRQGKTLRPLGPVHQAGCHAFAPGGDVFFIVGPRPQEGADALAGHVEDGSNLGDLKPFATKTSRQGSTERAATAVSDDNGLDKLASETIRRHDQPPNLCARTARRSSWRTVRCVAPVVAASERLARASRTGSCSLPWTSDIGGTPRVRSCSLWIIPHRSVIQTVSSPHGAFALAETPLVPGRLTV